MLVLSAVTSFRGASRTIATVLPLFGLSLRWPSWYAGRLWLLRLGYYKLMRAKPKAGDWVWIMDHTVQLGVEKCLLIPVVSETTREVVQEAMETVPTKNVLEWTRRHLRQSVQAKRKIAFSNTKKSAQIWDQLFDEL